MRAIAAFLQLLLAARQVLLYIMFGVASLAAAWVIKPHILVDDAAISFRYAKRFGQGLGLSYNDHERVMGFSNPLYTLILAGFSGSASIDLARMRDAQLRRTWQRYNRVPSVP